jgi:hypothetical protein
MRRLSLLLLALVAGCSPDYPLDKPGTWHLEIDGHSANDNNLRAMIVNPHDLVEGQGATTTLGAEAGRPVKRLLAGKRTPLPESNLLQLLGGASPLAAPQEGTDVGE